MFGNIFSSIESLLDLQQDNGVEDKFHIDKKINCGSRLFVYSFLSTHEQSIIIKIWQSFFKISKD